MKAPSTIAFALVLGGAAWTSSRDSDVPPPSLASSVEEPAGQVVVTGQEVFSGAELDGRLCCRISATATVHGESAPQRIVASDLLLLDHGTFLGQVQAMTTRACDSTQGVSLTLLDERGEFTVTWAPVPPRTWGQVRTETDVAVTSGEDR